MTTEVVVYLEPPLPEVQVTVDTVPPVVVTAIETALVGPAGPPGATGPPGAPGGSASLTQATPAATWTFAHNLNTYPQILVFLTAAPDVAVYTDVSYPDANTAVLTFPAAESGIAYAR